MTTYFFAGVSKHARVKLALLKKRDPNVQIRWDHTNKQVTYARGNLSERFDLRLLKKNPFEVGKQFLQRNKELFGNLDMETDLVEDKKVVDSMGMIHVSFQQQYSNIHVLGGSIRVHFSPEGRVSSITSKLVPDLKISVDAKISPSDAEKAALDHAGKGAVTIERRTPQLTILPHKGKYRLCWKVELDAHAQKKPAEWVYFVDAANGKVLFRYNNLRSPGTGQYSGSGPLNTHDPGTGTYQLRDATRSSWGGPEILTNDEDGASPSEDPDNDWDDLTTSPRDQNQGAEVDVHRYVGDAIDYFHTVHSRNSYDDAGHDVESDVHYLTDHNNAYWSPTYQKLLVGDGDGTQFEYLCADDVVAHELTHAVTNHSCAPVYNGESGAVDEAFSDCFAAFITGDWLIGEDIWDPTGTTTAPALRNLADPTNGGQYNPADGFNSAVNGHCPDHYDDRYTGSGDYNGVHINTTIISHAIYLMTVGGTHRTSGVTVTGIGQAAVETMLHNVQTVQLLGNTTPDFLDFREAMINACLDLYPDDLEKLASVKAAFKAVGVGPDLYLRDTPSDVGLEPNPAGVSCWSPDIIVRKDLPADPQTEFADPTRNDLSENVEYGQNNYVFVRVSNAGNHPADAEVDIYFCPITTFANPAAWQFLGTIVEPNIAPGEFRISNHLMFPGTAIPAPGHYCFVGVVRNSLDPAPDHSLISSVNEFRDFIQYSNNYAWKNIDVVDDITPGTPVTVQFDIRGIPNRQMRANLEIDLRHLPKGTAFEIRLPKAKVRGVNFSEIVRVAPRPRIREYFVERAHGLKPFNLRRRVLDVQDLTIFHIEPRKRGEFERMLLKPGEVVRARATVKLPKNTEGKQFTFSVKQIVDNIAVGQVNYVLRCARKEPVKRK